MPHVLLIEDSLDTLMLARLSLEGGGWTVETAETGMLALVAVQARRPDIVLLDSRLPDLEGWQVLQKIRLLPASGDVPVVLFTASQDDDAHYEGLDLRGKIPKPFNPMSLPAQLQALLRL